MNHRPGGSPLLDAPFVLASSRGVELRREAARARQVRLATPPHRPGVRAVPLGAALARVARAVRMATPASAGGAVPGPARLQPCATC